MNQPIGEQYAEDMKIIQRELEPFMLILEEQEVDIFSVAMFFSSYVKELLKNINNKKQREVIITNMLD